MNRPYSALDPVGLRYAEDEPKCQPVWFDPEFDEVIHKYWSPDWARWMPVTLCRYGHGHWDLHAQTGAGHDEAIAEGARICATRGILIRDQWDMIGPTGIYYPGIECLMLPSRCPGCGEMEQCSGECPTQERNA